jgi:hypothetical protein
MSEFYYAQLSVNDIVVGVSMLAGEVVADHMIRIAEYDVSLIGKRYNRDTGEFEAVEE